MSVTWGAAGTAASGTTSCTPAYPTGISALTSKILCAVTGRSNTADTAFTMPAGWTKIGSSELEGGTGTWGVDTGTRRVTFFQKDTTVGDETGTVTVSLAGTANNTLRATIFRVEVTSGYGIEYEATTGADTTNGTGFSATGGSIGFAPGDLLAILVAQNIDSATQSAQSITASGVTFGTRTNRASTAVTNGNDHRHILDTVPVSSGTATAAPTYAYTISASGSGPVAFLRMREIAPPVVTSQPTDQSVIDGEDASFTVAGTGYDSVKWQELISGGGSGAAYIEGSAQPLFAGANSITIPTGAVSAALLGTWWHGDASTPSWACTALPDLNTNRVFTNGNSGAPYQSGMLRTTSSVTATGAQTLTLSGQTEIYNGPGGFILFFDGEIEVIDGDANSVGDTGSASITLDSEAGATVIVLDSNLDTTTPPSTPGGWTELETVGNNNLSATLRMKTSSGSSESITSTSPNYETLIAYSIRGGASATWTDVSGATSTTLGLTGVTISDSGRQFRAVLTNTAGSTTSDAATLTVTDGKLYLVSLTTAPPESPTSTDTKTALAPTGVQAGDMEVICCGIGSIAPAAAPTINDTTSGWERVGHSDGSHQIGDGFFNLRMAVFMREATGSATDAVLTSSSSGYWGWHRFALRNANADFLAQLIFTSVAETTAPVVPGFTPEKTNALRVDWMTLGMLAAITPASGMTEWSENTDHGLGLYAEQLDDTTPTGTRTYGFSPSADAGVITLELHSLVSEPPGGMNEAASSLSAAVQLARSASASVAVPVQRGRSAGTALAMALQESRAAQAQIAAAVSQARAASMVLGLGVQAAAQSGFSADLVVQRALGAALEVDMAVSRAESAATAVALQVQAAAEASTSVDLMVQAGASQSVSAAVLVQELRQAAQDVALAIQQARTAAMSLAGAVQAQRNAGLSVGLASMLSSAAGASVDLQVQDGASLALALRAAVQFSADASVALDVSVSRLASAAVPLTLAVTQSRSLSLDIDVAVRRTSSGGFGASLFVVTPLMRFTEAGWVGSGMELWDGAALVPAQFQRWDGVEWV